MTITLNGTTGITTPAITNSGTLTQTGAATLSSTLQSASTIGVGGATPAASGAGITFPATQSASSDANTLDDYEEGTWTPVPTAQSGSITSYTSNGTYTKVGRTVVAWFNIVLTNVGTASGRMNLAGFPFTSITTGGPTACYFLVREDNVTGNTFYGALNGGNTTGVLSNSTYGAITWTNNYSYIGLVVYQASA